MSAQELPQLESSERLQAYQLITNGNYHVWSKGKLQEDRAREFLETLIPLTKADPYFLAHLTSYVFTKSQSKDLKIFLAYVNALSSADGTPFSPGSDLLKPNLRTVSYAGVHHKEMQPKMALRLLELSNLKYGIDGHLSYARHFPTGLKTALKKYLYYRESNPYILEGAVKAGMKDMFKTMYRVLHLNPTDEAASILRWKQRDREITFARQFDWTGLNDEQIAQNIQDDKIPYLSALGELGRINKKMSPIIALALLEQCTGDQAVILSKTFDDFGLLKHPEVKELYEQKIATAKTALDRVKTITQHTSEAVTKALKSAKSTQRKEATAGLGKIFVHVDVSSSMETALTSAKRLGAIIGEMINDPENNFAWGGFHEQRVNIPMPTRFSEDGFAQALFGIRTWGCTNAFANYEAARRFGADVDLFISDGGHNSNHLGEMIQRFHEQNPDLPKPKAVVQVDVGNSGNTIIANYQMNGIPGTRIRSEALTESALVVEAFKTAMIGPIAVVDEIMNTPLLTLPDYYYSL